MTWFFSSSTSDILTSVSFSFSVRALRFSLAACALPVLALGEQKLRVRRVWVTGERGDKFSVFGLVWVHCIVRAELERRSHALAAVHGYDPRYRYADTPSAIHGVLDGVPQPVQLSYEPCGEHRQPVGAYEEGYAQHDYTVHGAVKDEYGQPEQTRTTAAMPCTAAETLSKNVKNQPATASAATTGAQSIFKRIRIFLTSVFRIQCFTGQCKDAARYYQRSASSG